MNIFMILIMTVMLGMYQYFTAKRSSDVTLNKDEKAFEVELNCLKQFHDYGASRNESVLYSTELKTDYVCAGSENIKMIKYCLSGATEIDCGDSTVTQHCVATTSQKKGLENSLKALLFQKGIEEIKDKGYIKGIKISQLNHPVSTNETTTFGLATCIPAEQIKQNEKLANEDCKKQGKFATLKPDGTWECTDVPDLAECTAHEISYETTSGKENCTGPINGKYCCANTEIAKNICGNDPNLKATWNSSTRFYNCTTGDEICNNRDLSLTVVDENNSPIGSGVIIIPKPGESTPSSEKFYTAKYNSTKQAWDCIPNGKKLISECKKFTLQNKHAYVSVSNLSVANSTPVCNGASSQSASAIETCSACGTAEVDPVTNQWKCSYAKTWAELRGKGAEYIDRLRGGSSGTNNKGVQACFQGCTEEMIASIKAGKPNGISWGLSWNPTSLLWECFSCDKENQVKGAYMNENCKPTNTDDTKECKDDTYTDANCNQNKINGRCVLKCCNELYQKRGTDGGCYTKWCRNIPSEVNAVINRPQDKTCPSSHPRLMYNTVQDCVYCIRTPPTRV